MKGQSFLSVDVGIKKQGMGYVVWDGETILEWNNLDFVDFMRRCYWREFPKYEFVVMEMISPHSVSGYSTIQTTLYMGRLWEFFHHANIEVKFITRGTVRSHQLPKTKNSSRNDALIRQTLKEKYPHLRLPTKDATSAFAIATTVTELDYKPNYYNFVQKKRKLLTPEQRERKRVLFEKNELRKAEKIISKYKK